MEWPPRVLSTQCSRRCSIVPSVQMYWDRDPIFSRTSWQGPGAWSGPPMMAAVPCGLLQCVDPAISPQSAAHLLSSFHHEPVEPDFVSGRYGRDNPVALRPHTVLPLTRTPSSDLVGISLLLKCSGGPHGRSWLQCTLLSPMRTCADGQTEEHPLSPIDGHCSAAKTWLA
ncbi:hypothetical protein BT67DRAFT_14921 [Trichocladium antarcticum]|uniref:Uncharacterized protein n=1 Tax=Trichocladium antarcticum TaxID=1450529 RepID=A0AAN6ZGT1_9PEZI|nr:hypothetical protein BT67DRAFT_14921 [Trichocladium antarcticum]